MTNNGWNLSSRIPGFYRLDPSERLNALGHQGVKKHDLDVYRSEGLELSDADLMVENVISTFRLPNAVAVNFLINGVDRLMPMVVEEPSVVAAVSNMARLTRPSGGFFAESDPSIMIGQIQLTDVQDPERCIQRLRAALPELKEIAKTVHPRLEERGGGIRDFEIRTVTYDESDGFEQMVVLHVHIDCVDAMGANMVNTVAERLAPYIEAKTQETVGLKILSNLADQRLARAYVELEPEHIAGKGTDPILLAEQIAAAWRFAWADPYRAATHNKGVMNGIDAVALATGNDWRAIEAGAHAWCARDGQYRPLTRWTYKEGRLRGEIELPTQFGTVGGPIRVHPTVQSNLRLMGVETARELAACAAALGLAQNLGALRALASEGIQAGHMRMHARTIAATAGARPSEVASITARLIGTREFSVEHAKAIIKELRKE